MSLPLILASTSIYRRELMDRLGIPYQSRPPQFNEDEAKGLPLSPPDLALYLATQKAKSLSTTDNCVIGGDQMVVLGTEIFGKPKTHEKAMDQLTRMSGKTHGLLTATAIIHKGQIKSWVNFTKMKMRSLTTEQIETYLQIDEPYDCAGSYKIEKTGISLFEKIDTTDFTAIQGLPLMEVTMALSQLGYTIPQKRTS